MACQDLADLLYILNHFVLVRILRPDPLHLFIVLCALIRNRLALKIERADSLSEQFLGCLRHKSKLFGIKEDVWKVVGTRGDRRERDASNQKDA